MSVSWKKSCGSTVSSTHNCHPGGRIGLVSREAELAKIKLVDPNLYWVPRKVLRKGRQMT